MELVILSESLSGCPDAHMGKVSKVSGIIKIIRMHPDVQVWEKVSKVSGISKIIRMHVRMVRGEGSGVNGIIKITRMQARCMHGDR